MPKRRLSAEQIVVLLRQVEVLMSQARQRLLLAARQGSRSRAITGGARNTVGLKSIKRSG
jgi:hypothetical protein